MFSSKELEAIRQIIQTNAPVSIVVHRNPDGDALGSSIGLKLYLQKRYNRFVQVVIPDPFPQFLDWLPCASETLEFEAQPEFTKEVLHTSGLVFCLDFNHPSRVGGMEEVLRGVKCTTVMIDHHQEPDPFVTFMCSDTNASSTCEMVMEFIQADGGDAYLDQDIARCLYTGIMTDTGSFRFSATKPKTHLLTARLLETGIEQWKIHESIFNQNSLSKLQLWGFAMSQKMVQLEQHKTCYIVVTAEELETHHYQEGDLEGLVNFALSIRGTVLAVLFSERKGRIRISFRSVGDFPANQLSKKYFNGGGHINAAGGSFEGTLDDAVATFNRILPEYQTLLDA
jgi:phosphoesterase RecJ-like protein